MLVTCICRLVERHWLGKIYGASFLVRFQVEQGPAGWIGLIFFAGRRLWSHANATVHLLHPAKEKGEMDGDWRESTHDRSALPIGKRPPRTNSENGKLSVSETFCDTWTQFFWGHRKPPHCNITASVSLDRRRRAS
jgi:hypothetical protein